jgi:D-tyrosyl-tRNA(Tyr) deacylase
MRVVVQRAKDAKVVVGSEVVGQISRGLVLLIGITHDDLEEDIQYVADKVVNLRIFEDEYNKMNLSLLEVGGDILSVSQFTLYGDSRKGRRPNFMNAAKPDYANELYELFNQTVKAKGIRVETGIFGAMMDVSFTNDGPVTLIIDSKV